MGTPRITGPQESYLRRLANEAFSHLVESGVDVHHLDKLSKQEASDRISTLLELKKRGWPRETKRPMCADCGKFGETTGHQTCEYPR
jgi:hypothetical protein